MSKVSIARGILAVLSVVAYKTIWTVPVQNGMNEHAETLMKTLKFPEGEKMRASYTGIEGVDEIARILVGAFYPVVRDFAGNMVNWELMMMIMGAFVHFWADAIRPDGSIFLKLPSVWGLVAQMITGAATIPAYYASTVGSTMTNSQAPDPSSVQAVLPGVLVGGVIPTIIMLSPGLFNFTPDQHQIVIAVWQLMPVWIAVSFQLFALVLPRVNSSKSSKETIRQAYFVMGLINVAVRIFILVRTAQNPDVSLADIYIPQFLAKTTLVNSSKMLFVFDVHFCATAMVTWASFVLGARNGLGTVKTFGLLCAGGLVLSPGATFSFALWAWREEPEKAESKKRQ